MSKDQSIALEIFKGTSLSKEEIRFCSQFFEKKEFKKGDIVFTSDNIIEDMYFITEGCLRTYYIDKSGKEHTVQFGIRDWWISDFTAFFSQSKAIMNLEVLQDASVYKLSFNNREKLLEQIPAIHKHIRQKLENAYAAFQKRILSNLSLSAKEQYLDFINSHPNIEKKIKNYHIASYLGITTESLSRIRKEISKS